MLQKNIEVKSQKVQSYDEKSIQSLQHSKDVKNLADRLREEIDRLFYKQKKARTAKWSYHEEYQKLKAKGEEEDADFYYRSFRTWSDEEKRLIEIIQIKLKAVQKFETPKKMKKPKIIDKKKQQLKQGPSDEEE